MGKVKVHPDQYLIDIAIQECGSVEGLVAIAVENGLRLDHGFDSPGEIEVPMIVKHDVVTFFKNKGLKVATKSPTDVAMGGIGYMKIGGNFKVS